MKRRLSKVLVILLLAAVIPSSDASTIFEEAAPHCTLATAQELSPGISNGSVDLLGSVQIAFGCGPSGAFFALPLLFAGQPISVDLISNGSGYLVQPVLYDSAANVLAIGIAGSPFHELIMNFVAPASQVYYIAVASINGASHGTYNLAVNLPLAPCGPGAVCPEPGTLALLALGIVSLAATRRRKLS